MLSKLLSFGGSYIRNNIAWNREYFQIIADKYRYRSSRSHNHLAQFPKPEEVLNAPYCFILSTGRCGTALLTKILDLSPRLLVHHNPKPELEWVSSLIHQESPPLDCLRLAILAARFDKFFLEAFQRDRIYDETNNRISLFAPTLAQILPNSKFIHIVRDPANFVRSGMRRNYYADGTVQHQRLMPTNDPGWNQMSQLEKIAWEWNEINQNIEQFKAEIDSNRIMTITSESLFNGHKNGTVTALWDFIGVPPPLSEQKRERRLQKLFLRPVNRQVDGDFPKFNNWSEDEKASLSRIATLSGLYGYPY